jgi:hypothetical protein
MANLSNVGPTLAAHPSDAAGLIAGLVTVVAWGSAFVVQKPALARVTSFQVTWLGVVAATIA